MLNTPVLIGLRYASHLQHRPSVKKVLASHGAEHDVMQHVHAMLLTVMLPCLQAVVLPSPGGQPPSAASTPPGPQSESSAPNLALLVAEASPAKDAAGSTGDQHTSLSPSQDAGAVKLLGGKPLNPVSPGQTTVLMPQHVSAGKLQGQMGSPDARYSPKRSPGAASTAPRLLPGGPVAMSVRASSPSASPNSGYLGPQPATSGVQRPANAAPGCWTPQMQPGQHQQAVSCPPIPGPGAATPTSSAPAAAGLMPQSAGQLGGAAPGSAAVQRRVEELSQETSTLKTTVTELQQQLSWVNTSRGSGTPMPFNGMSPQQLFASPGLPGAGSPLASGLCTPATGSTTRSAGSLTHVQSVNSIAGSCGGSVPGFTGTPGSTTPMSVGSTASGAGGPSAGSGSPARPPITELLGRLDDLANASKMVSSHQGWSRCGCLNKTFTRCLVWNCTWCWQVRHCKNDSSKARGRT